MFRRIVIVCALMMALEGSSYAQTQTQPPKKIKPAKIKKVKPAKPPKAPKPTTLTPSEKAIKKANDKNIRQQRKAFEKQNKQQQKQLKAQQNAIKKSLKQAKK